MTRQDIIDESMSKFWNVRDEYKGKTLEELQTICRNDALPFAVCAVNITGDLNLGMMIRTASVFGAERFFIYGRHGYDRRSTVGAQNYIEIVKIGHIDRGTTELDYSELIPSLEDAGYTPIFIETGYDSLYGFDPAFDIPENTKPCLVFGNEGVGIPKEIIVEENAYSIPQRGVLRSLNVSSAATVAINYLSQLYTG